MKTKYKVGDLLLFKGTLKPSFDDRKRFCVFQIRFVGDNCYQGKWIIDSWGKAVSEYLGSIREIDNDKDFVIMDNLKVAKLLYNNE